MSERVVIRILWSCAVLFLVLGIGMTVKSAGEINEHKKRFRHKLVDLKELRSMECEIGRYIAAQRVFEQLVDKRSVPLEGLLKDTLSGYKADDIREVRRESAPGWVVRQKEIAFSDVQIGKIMEFVHRAEAESKGQSPSHKAMAPLGKVSLSRRSNGHAGAKAEGQNREQQRPPWRLIRCVIRASPRMAGSGHVAVVLEALEKTEGKILRNDQ